jgi:inosine/xanthosine triphosphatase
LTRRGRSLRIRVGSSNPVKVEAVRDVLERLFSDELDIVVEAVDVGSGVPDEPWEDDVIEGAGNRASRAIGDADLGVGIEAGLFKLHGETVDVQYCVIVDKEGRLTWGHGPAFRYPPPVYEGVSKGRTVGEVMGEITGIDDIGRKGGSIHYLTKGLLDRKGLTEQAVLMAMVPRIRKELY